MGTWWLFLVAIPSSLWFLSHLPLYPHPTHSLRCPKISAHVKIVSKALKFSTSHSQGYESGLLANYNILKWYFSKCVPGWFIQRRSHVHMYIHTMLYTYNDMHAYTKHMCRVAGVRAHTHTHTHTHTHQRHCLLNMELKWI